MKKALSRYRLRALYEKVIYFGLGIPDRSPGNNPFAVVTCGLGIPDKSPGNNPLGSEMLAANEIAIFTRITASVAMKIGIHRFEAERV